MAAVSVLLLVRRWTGGLTQPIPVLGLLAVGSVLAVLAAACRWQLFHGDSEASISYRRAWSLAVALLLVMFASILSLPGTSQVGLCLLWGVVLIEEAAVHGIGWYYGTLRGSSGGARQERIASQIIGRVSHDASTVADEEQPKSNLFGLPDGEGHGFPGEVWQQLTHTRDGSGQGAFYGRLRGEFAAGQRSTSLHVAFCPPLETVPQVFAEQLEGPEVTIRTVQVLPYGIRFDVKRSSLGSSSETVVIEFYAS